MDSKVIRMGFLMAETDVHFLEGASLCFGHFNAIHPGHIRYFRTARQHEKKLIVALEGDKHLTELEHKVVFSEIDRAHAVAALDIVDYVVILDVGHLEDLVQLIEPTSLILGKEFEEERSSKVAKAVSRIHTQGGQVFYEPGETHYATADLFYGSQDDRERERWRKFGKALLDQNIDLGNVYRKLLVNNAPRILILGDTIVDRYVASDPIGMSNEAPVVVVKELEVRDFVGGASIVAAHVAALGADCTYLSVTGEDRRAKWVESELAGFGVKTILLKDSSRPTTLKIRYMVENQKLFRVSRLKEHPLAKRFEDAVVQYIIDLAPNLDGILVCDFVYGVITQRVIETLERVSRENNLPLFGDLQCSSQIGNVSKFRRFNLLCPTEREARIALGNQDDGVEYVANLLMEKTQSSNLILKLGAEGFISYYRVTETEMLHRQYFPALSVNPLDVSGAGDALLASVAISMTHGLTLMEASALGCCVSALAVQTVGNQPINLEDVKRFIEQRSRTVDAI